jgi:erythromycin esterase-like protein
MAADGMVNVGQLVRQQHAAEGVVLVGFGSYRGTVIAGDYWGAPVRKMPVPPARRGSWEDVLHRSCEGDTLLIFGSSATEPLLAPRGHRAIGVVYRPDVEAYGNYVPTVMPKRYDAFVYLAETTALHPLHISPDLAHEAPQTFPTGV